MLTESKVEAPDFRALFDAVPLPCVVLTPAFTIVAVNGAYLRATGRTLENILGQNVFEAFPDNPDDPHATGVANLSASLNRVLQTKAADTMAPQKYDIPVSTEAGTQFEERYWSPVNIPLLDSEGNLKHILNRAEDITALVKSQTRATEMESQISAQTLLIEHQEQFAALFQQAPTLMTMMTGPEHRFVFANPGYLNLVRNADVLGKTVKDVFPGAVGQGFIELLDEVYRTGNPYTANGARYMLQAEAGGSIVERYFDFVYQPLRNAKGQIQGIFAQGIDVTERVLADLRRDALIKLTDEFRDLTTPEGITYSASKVLGETLGVSQAGYGTIDHDAETLHIDCDWNAPGSQTIAETLHLRDFGSFIDDMKLGKLVVVNNVDLDGRTASGKEGLKARGAIAFVNVPILERNRLVAVLFVANGQPRSWDGDDLAFIKEVAERTRTTSERLRNELALRESEAKFRTIADAMPQMVWSTLRDGYHDYYNQQWYEYTGAPAGSTDGEGWNGMFHPDDQPRAWEVWRHSLATGETYEIHYRLRHRSGQYRWVLGRALPVRDRSGKITRWMGTCTDIHDQKLAEEKLKDADRRKDEFLAMLAHELRNPLAPIAAAADLLQLGLDASRAKQTSAIITRQVKHMTGLVDDLLDVSRVTRNLVTLNKASLDVKRILFDAVEQVRPLIESRRHQFVLRTPPDTAFVMGDQKRLVQVVTNLLTNAAKYTPQDGEIILSMEVDERYIKMSVADNGIGMTPELVSRAFDLFTQAERTADRSQGGLGIGLALVKSLVELHGGTISAYSAGPGQGSTFTLCLPHHRAQEPTSRFESDSPLEMGGSKRQKVMVVDDNVDAAHMLAMLIETLGYQVVVEHHPVRALERSVKERPDVFFLDIGLPDMDGNELARRLRGQLLTAHAILIAVTGYGQEQGRDIALNAGFDHYFAKPIDSKKLASLLAELGNGDSASGRQ